MASARLLEVLDLDGVAPAGRERHGDGVLSRRVLGPGVDQQLPVEPQARTVVRDDRERVGLRVPRLELAGPAGREVVGGQRRRGRPGSPREVDRRIRPGDRRAGRVHVDGRKAGSRAERSRQRPAAHPARRPPAAVRAQSSRRAAMSPVRTNVNDLVVAEGMGVLSNRLVVRRRELTGRSRAGGVAFGAAPEPRAWRTRADPGTGSADGRETLVVDRKSGSLQGNPQFPRRSRPGRGSEECRVGVWVGGY